MSKITRVLAGGLLAVGVSTAYAFPDFAETEPNDTKALANVTPALNPGDGLTGVSTGSTGAAVDYFKVNINGGALGIYRNRLTKTTNTTASGNGATIRGFTQTDGPTGGIITTTETGIQTQTGSLTAPPGAFLQWYGFGKQEMFHFRVTGVAASTAGYRWEYSQLAVTPTAIGSYAPGSIDLNWTGQGHTTDTDIWVYDSALQPIPGYGNDDNTGLQSRLTRNYTPGTYYVAAGRFNTANNQASPEDDNFETGAVAEFAGMVLTSSTGTNANTTFTITDSQGTALQVVNTTPGAFDINWFCFVVTPEPSALALLALGGVALFRRR
jgi:hypothetical protein